MKLFIGAISATLIVAATAAQAGPLAPSGVGGSSPYQKVSDFDGPYYSDAPPPVPAPIPRPLPRYGYGSGPDDGYRRAPVYGPGPDAYRPDPYRQDPYRQDGYRPGPDYGYAPAFLPIQEVYAIIRDNGFSPLGQPRQRGYTYVISVLDREGEDGRLVIDARSGRIVRFVPAFQSGDDYEPMRYEPGQNLQGRDLPGQNLQVQIAPHGGLDNLPPPTVIKADPNLLQATPAIPAVPHSANRTAALAPTKPITPLPAARPVTPSSPQTAAVQPKPVDAVKPADVKPAPQATASVAQPQATPSQASAEQKPASPILPTEKMPAAQGLE
jgi:hypothetical protein